MFFPHHATGPWLGAHTCFLVGLWLKSSVKCFCAGMDLVQVAILQMGTLRPRERKQCILSHPGRQRMYLLTLTGLWFSRGEPSVPKATAVYSVQGDRILALPDV